MGPPGVALLEDSKQIDLTRANEFRQMVFVNVDDRKPDSSPTRARLARPGRYRRSL